ncbi:MAG TPA: 3-oxoadipate enol-lactonase [Jiangellaceae bacterium]|nr:3-oxoadipate enol-lactonase [Jiangellaceae bacterium]
MTSVRLGYEVHGPADAPCVVLGGSLGTTRAMWDDVLPHVAKLFRVVTYDHLGHGQSSVPTGPYTIDELADDVVALMDEVGIAQAHLGGVSLGGMVAIRIAATYPGRVIRLGLVCTSAHIPPPSMWHNRAATVREYGMSAVLEPVTRRWFTPQFAATPRAQQLQLQFLNVPVEGYAGCCEAIASMDLRPALREISAPTLVIAGQDDPATPTDHARVIESGIAEAGGTARSVVVPGAHLAAVEQPKAVSTALLEHWLTS